MTYYKGTSYNQDGRFINKDNKLLENLVYPDEYKETVQIQKINVSIIKSWIERKLNDILGFEDECLSNYIINQLEASEEYVNPKKLQYSLTGFLEKNTFDFMKELWKILLSAQKTSDGIPLELIQDKKEEIIQKTQKKKEKLKFLDDLLGNTIQKEKNDKPAIINNKKEDIGLIDNKDKDRSRSSSKSSSSSSSSNKSHDKHRKTHKSSHQQHHHHHHRHRHSSSNRKHYRSSHKHSHSRHYDKNRKDRSRDRK